MPAVPEVLAAYLAYEAGQNRRPSTLSRRLAAIRSCIPRHRGIRGAAGDGLATIQRQKQSRKSGLESSNWHHRKDSNTNTH